MQPDTTQVNRFHSRPLDLRKPNAKTGALQMLKLINRGFALGPPECLLNRHNAKMALFTPNQTANFGAKRSIGL